MSKVGTLMNATELPWMALGLGYSVALWAFAMQGMSSLHGGMPPFVGFEPTARLSLVGHLGLGIAAATTMLAGGTS